VTLVLTAASVGLGFLTKPPDKYQATAAVRVERVVTGANLLTELFSISTADNLTTQVAVISGFPVLLRAAKLLQWLPANVSSDEARNNPQYQRVIKRLEAMIQAEQQTNTNIIRITATSGDRTEVKKVANAVAEAYRDESTETRNSQVREAKKFIEKQRAEVGERLRRAEDELRALKERRGFVSLSEETAASLARLAALETEYERVRRARDEVAASLRQLQEGRPGAVVRIAPDPTDASLSKLAGALTDLQTQRENLLLTLTPRHPQVRELDAQIENVRASFRQELEARLRALTARAADLEARVRQARAQNQAIPEVSLELARVQREVKLNEELYTQLETKYQEFQIREKEQIQEVKIELWAADPSAPSNPTDWGTKLAAGGLVGLLLGLVLAFTLESLDTSIGTIEDVENFLAVPVMGLIPDIGPDDLVIPGAPEGRQEAQPFLIALQNPSSTIAEAYRSLRTNLDFVALERQIKTIIVTSASRTEGKSTTAVNLAITMAQMGRRTLLVETDLRKPFLHFAFGIPKEPGLAEAILGNQPWTAVLRSVTDLMLGRLGLDQIVGAPNIDQLHLITSGAPPSNPAEFLNSQRMTELIAAFRQEFDIVIFDCAPVLPVTDAAVLASKTDGTLLVHRVGTIARAALRRSKTLLENVHGRVLGVVLTGLKPEVSADFEELEYYRYGYGEGVEGGTKTSPGARGPRAAKRGRLASLFSSKTSLLLVGALAGAGLGTLATTAPGPTPPPSPAPPPVAPEAWQEGVAAVALAVLEDIPRGPSAAISEQQRYPPQAAPSQAQPTSPRQGPAGAIGLQLASFREPARARDYVERLRGDGLPALSVPVQVAGKGRWVRVFLGPFPSERAAAAMRQRLPADQAARATAHQLPYAVESDPLTSYERAAAVVARIRDLGYAPSVVPAVGLAGAPRFRVVVEGFATPAEAQMVAMQLHRMQAGFRGVAR
jgi:capsular exopolysaccharide synthesis family protein